MFVISIQYWLAQSPEKSDPKAYMCNKGGHNDGPFIASTLVSVRLVEAENLD